MSIAEQITRINGEKQRIAAVTTKFGITDNDAANIKTIADAMESVVIHDCTNQYLSGEGQKYDIVPGYHKGGTVYWLQDDESEATRYLLETERKVTPLGNEDQTITASEGYYGLGPIIVKKIPHPYHNVSNVTAIGPDVLETSWFIDKDGILQQGTMADKSGWKETLSLSKTSIDVPFGFHNGGGSVSISLDDAREVTPNEGTQSIIPPTDKVLSVVTVKPIPTKYKDLTNQTITADDVLNTAKFIDKETGEAKNGAISDLGEVNEVLSPDITRSDPFYTVACQIPKGYHNGKGSVSALVSNTYEATPSETKQTIVANSGSFMGQFTVQPIPTKYKDLTNQLLEPSQVLKGGRFIDKTTGVLTYGAIENLGEVRGTINTYSQTGYYITSGGHFDAISIELDNSDLIAKLQEI